MHALVPEPVEYVPGRQDEQAEAPGKAVKRPAAQDKQLVSPKPVLKDPSGHAGQAVLLVKVHTAVWIVPGAHVLQSRQPSWFVPCQ